MQLLLVCIHIGQVIYWENKQWLVFYIGKYSSWFLIVEASLHKRGCALHAVIIIWYSGGLIIIGI